MSGRERRRAIVRTWRHMGQRVAAGRSAGLSCDSRRPIIPVSRESSLPLSCTLTRRTNTMFEPVHGPMMMELILPYILAVSAILLLIGMLFTKWTGY
jgi:hypothetical protein